MFRTFINALSLGCAFVIGWLFTFASISQQNQFLQPLFLGLIWSLLLSFYIKIFARKAINPEGKGCWFAFKKALKNILRYLFLSCFILVTLATCYFSFRLGSI